MSPYLLPALWTPFLIMAFCVQLAIPHYADKLGMRRDRAWIYPVIIAIAGPLGLILYAASSLQSALRSYIFAPPPLPESFAALTQYKTGRELFQALEAMSVEERRAVKKVALSLTANLPRDEQIVLYNLIEAKGSFEERERLGYE